jgi:hypothetical protein
VYGFALGSIVVKKNADSKFQISDLRQVGMRFIFSLEL